MSEFILAGIISFILICTILQNKEHRKERSAWQRERAEEHGLWLRERQHLLDRIQAPSYDHLKHHEARIIKAGKEPVKETNPLEVV